MEHLINYYSRKEKSELVELLAECAYNNMSFFLELMRIENRKTDALIKEIKKRYEDEH